jgi:hypothetical protein
MLSRMEAFVCRVAAQSTSPDWTLLAVSYIAFTAIVLVLRWVFVA